MYSTGIRTDRLENEDNRFEYVQIKRIVLHHQPPLLYIRVYLYVCVSLCVRACVQKLFRIQFR